MEAAIREKQIAVTMVGNKDYLGAREKLIKAKNYFPGIENIIEMICVCDILHTTEIEFSGCGTDWYWVLQTNVNADESHIESKYKSLISLLEPIKNKFPGTESALKLIENAYSVLSDREKRSEFDAKRDAIWSSYHSRELQEPSYPETMSKGREATSQSSSGSKRIASECSDRSNGVCNSREHPSKRSKGLGGDDLQVTAETQVTDKIIENFCTQEVSWPSWGAACKETRSDGEERSLSGSSGSPSSLVKAMSSEEPDLEPYDFDNNRKAEVFAVGQIWVAYDREKMPRNYARINSIETSPFKLYVSWLKPAPVNTDERRWHEVGLPVSCGCFKLDRFKLDETNMVVGERPVFSHLVSSFQGSTNEPVEMHPQRGEVWALYKDWQPFKWCSDPETRKGCGFRIVEILTGYSKDAGVRVAWLEKVAGSRSIFQRYKDKGSEFSSQISVANLFMFSHNIPALRFVGGEMDVVSDGMLELDPLSVPEDVVMDTVVAKPPLERRSRSPPITSEPKARSLKPKWSQEDFTSGQIWALYDGQDSMPRCYAVVNDVVSGCEVCVTYLEPHPMLEDEIHWVEEGLPFVFGLFRTGRTKLNLGLLWFSHLVKCKNSMNRYIHRIFPRKGEIWAMYKNWNPKWKLSNFSSYQYCVVEILSDFSESTTMRIGSLEGVKSHMTFFQRQLDNGFELIREVSPKEMLSFSHRIPAFTVPGIENLGIPEGSWHLEPDALPPKLTN